MPQEPDESDGLEELAHGLTPEQIRRYTHSLRYVASQAVRQAVPPLLETYREEIGYSEEVAGLVRLLAARTNDSKEDVLAKALTLYGLAVNAHENGNRLAILNPEDEVVQDVFGFDDDPRSTEASSRPLAAASS